MTPMELQRAKKAVLAAYPDARCEDRRDAGRKPGRRVNVFVVVSGADVLSGRHATAALAWAVACRRIKRAKADAKVA